MAGLSGAFGGDEELTEEDLERLKIGTIFPR